jgi:hypothetical protein
MQTSGGVIGHTTPGNNIHQSQTGSHNVSVVVQSNPNAGTVTTTQTGSHGSIFVKQSGSGNVAIVNQSNTAIVDMN